MNRVVGYTFNIWMLRLTYLFVLIVFLLFSRVFYEKGGHTKLFHEKGGHTKLFHEKGGQAGLKRRMTKYMLGTWQFTI